EVPLRERRGRRLVGLVPVPAAVLPVADLLLSARRSLAADPVRDASGGRRAARPAALEPARPRAGDDQRLLLRRPARGAAVARAQLRRVHLWERGGAAPV